MPSVEDPRNNIEACGISQMGISYSLISSVLHTDTQMILVGT